jgi:hypothetical protein
VLRNPTRTIITNIAGCASAEEAKAKARKFFDVEAIRKVEENAE